MRETFWSQGSLEKTPQNSLSHPGDVRRPHHAAVRGVRLSLPLPPYESNVLNGGF